MKATRNRCDDVVITFNHQAEKLQAPDDNGRKMQWLPCEDCHELLPVEWDVVCFTCQVCFSHKEWCDSVDCDDPAHTPYNPPRPFECFVHDPVP